MIHWILASLIIAVIVAMRLFQVPYKIALLALVILIPALAVAGLWQLKSSLWFVLCLAPMAVGLVFVAKGIQSPPIADVTTRLDPMPEFPANVAAASENTMEFGEAQREAHEGKYAHLRALRFKQPPIQAIKNAAQSMGWQLIEEGEQTLRFESRSRLLGFVDDIVVVIEPDDGAWVVNARSRSRVGVSDLGANAARIQKLWNQLSRLTKA